MTEWDAQAEVEAYAKQSDLKCRFDACPALSYGPVAQLAEARSFISLKLSQQTQSNW